MPAEARPDPAGVRVLVHRLPPNCQPHERQAAPASLFAGVGLVDFGSLFDPPVDSLVDPDFGSALVSPPALEDLAESARLSVR